MKIEKWVSSYDQRAVVGDELLLDVLLGGLINVLLVVGDDALGDGLTDGVDLGSAATRADADADVELLELVSTDDQEGLSELHGQGLGGDEVDGRAIDTENAGGVLGGLDEHNSDGGLLAAEALDLFCFC